MAMAMKSELRKVAAAPWNSSPLARSGDLAVPCAHPRHPVASSSPSSLDQQPPTPSRHGHPMGKLLPSRDLPPRLVFLCGDWFDPASCAERSASTLTGRLLLHMHAGGWLRAPGKEAPASTHRCHRVKRGGAASPISRQQ